MLTRVLSPQWTEQRTPFLEQLQNKEMQAEQYELRAGDRVSGSARVAALIKNVPPELRRAAKMQLGPSGAEVTLGTSWKGKGQSKKKQAEQQI